MTGLVDITEYLRSLEIEMTAAAVAARAPLIPVSFPLGRSWFVACTDARGELEAEASIRGLGFEVFCPMEAKTKRRRGRRVDVREAVFPGYLFVRFDRERDDWGSITDADGVMGILKNGQMPTKVNDIIIARLMNAEEAGVFDAGNRMQEGQAVEIMEGPFTGLMARVKSATAKKRIKILLDAMGTIEIDSSFLRKI